MKAYFNTRAVSNYTSIILSGLFTLQSFAAVSQSEWQLNKNQEGIRVYTKDEKGSEFKAFKAIITINASIDKVINRLKNANEYKEWYGYTKTSILLKRDNNVQYNYVETLFPWPFRNRDMVYRMLINTHDSGVVRIDLKGISDYIPERKGIVRMSKAEGSILLQPLEKRITEVTYVFHSEPGSNIPAWLANSSVAELPFKTLTGLRKILREEINFSGQ